MEERLSKLICWSGLASRRGADKMIRDGRVTVNGTIVDEPGTKVDPEQAHIKVDGKQLAANPTPVYLLLNKPRGVLATRADGEGRATVVTLLRGFKGRILPVGRLDPDDEGLMILTSDHELASALSKPDSGIPRTFLVKVKGIPLDRTLDKLRLGVPLKGGRSLPMLVRRLSSTSQNTWLRIVLREQRGNLLKWALAKLKHPVLKLKSVDFGPLSVKGLAPRTYRELSHGELAAVRELALNPPGLPEPLSPEEEIEWLARARARKPRRPPGAAKSGSSRRGPPKPKARKRPSGRSPMSRNPRRLDKAAVMRARSGKKKSG